MKSRKSWLFTFGCGHKYPNTFVRIHAESRGAARGEMFRRFGTQWAFQYTGDMAEVLSKYNIFEITEEELDESERE